MTRIRAHLGRRELMLGFISKSHVGMNSIWLTVFMFDAGRGAPPLILTIAAGAYSQLVAAHTGEYKGGDTGGRRRGIRA